MIHKFRKFAQNILFFKFLEQYQQLELIKAFFPHIVTSQDYYEKKNPNRHKNTQMLGQRFRFCRLPERRNVMRGRDIYRRNSRTWDWAAEGMVIRNEAVAFMDV